MQTNQTSNIDTNFVVSSNGLLSENISCRSIIPRVSTEVVELGDLNKKITIRNTNISRIAFTYNLVSERRKLKNLIGNGYKIYISKTDSGIE